VTYGVTYGWLSCAPARPPTLRFRFRKDDEEPGTGVPGGVASKDRRPLTERESGRGRSCPSTVIVKTPAQRLWITTEAGAPLPGSRSVVVGRRHAPGERRVLRSGSDHRPARLPGGRNPRLEPLEAETGRLSGVPAPAAHGGRAVLRLGGGLAALTAPPRRAAGTVRWDGAVLRRAGTVPLLGVVPLGGGGSYIGPSQPSHRCHLPSMRAVFGWDGRRFGVSHWDGRTVPLRTVRRRLGRLGRLGRFLSP
jgi:hypothetical protein